MSRLSEFGSEKRSGSRLERPPEETQPQSAQRGEVNREDQPTQDHIGAEGVNSGVNHPPGEENPGQDQIDCAHHLGQPQCQSHDVKKHRGLELIVQIG